MIPSAGHLFYVADVSAPILDDADAHHAARVLRLRDGEVLSVGDGAGHWRRGRWTGRGIEPDGEVMVEPPVVRPVAVGFALVKGSKPELVVQKLTELGVDRIVPFTAARSVVRWDPGRGERGEGVDPDAGRSQFTGEGPGHHQHGRLADRVERHPSAQLQGARRSRVDDRGVRRAGQHQGQRIVGREIMALQIDREGLVELFFRDIESVRAARADVGAQHIQPAGGLADPVEQ